MVLVKNWLTALMELDRGFASLNRRQQLQKVANLFGGIFGVHQDLLDIGGVVVAEKARDDILFLIDQGRSSNLLAGFPDLFPEIKEIA